MGPREQAEVGSCGTPELLAVSASLLDSTPARLYTSSSPRSAMVTSTASASQLKKMSRARAVVVEQPSTSWTWAREEDCSAAAGTGLTQGLTRATNCVA
jgi:hypothetical protein